MSLALLGVGRATPVEPLTPGAIQLESAFDVLAENNDSLALEV